MGLTKLSVSLLALAGTSIAADLPPIVAKGSKFFYENGTQFFMKGIAYQQDTAAGGATDTKKTSFKDPLSDATLCKRDVPLLKELGTNTIRTYAIDPTADHSACMKLLSDAGIYVVSDLSQPQLSINRDDPSWDTDLFTRYKDVVDELSKYSNVIGFFAGNEVSNNRSNTEASAFVKAAVRDTKKYIKNKKSSRWLGVGYAANDDEKIRADIAHYFNCGTEEDSIDFWGYNIYSWCGQSTLQKSGYSTQAEFFKDYSVPVFFAEYGCNTDGAANRIWQETGALYSDEMTAVFSGGIVYMYFQEENDYGLVKATGSGSPTKLKDFNALKTQVNKADPKGVDSDSYTPKNTMPKDCPKQTSNWSANSVLPPTPDDTLCECMVKSRSCVPDSDLASKSYGKIFDYICGKDPKLCTGITGNATSGVYGAFSMCAAKDRLAFALDAYYEKQGKSSSACDFNGQAKTQSATKASSCEKSLDEADKINEEAATATTPVGGGGSDPGSGSNSTADDKSAGILSARMTPAFSVGDYAIGMYVLVAGLVGAGMVAM